MLKYLQRLEDVVADGAVHAVVFGIGDTTPAVIRMYFPDYVAEKTASKLVTVSGPKSMIDSIGDIVVEVDVTNQKGTFHSYEVPKAYDKEGKLIDPTSLKYSDNLVAVDIVMYRTKTIPLLITTVGKPADGYVMTDMNYEPKEIEVAGDYLTLSNIQNLSVSESIEDASQNIEKDINLQDLLAEGLILVGDNQTATINITIEKAATKEVSIQTGNIEIRNMPATMDMVYLSSLPVTLKLSGPSADMADITEKSITPYIDLTDFSVGTYELTINIDAPEKITLADSPKISVYLTLK
jgi:YbbR domain-containing protein